MGQLISITQNFVRHEETRALFEIKLIDMVLSCYRYGSAAWTFDKTVIPVYGLFYFVWCLLL